MRLIIRDDPTQASSYIAKYIIGTSLHPASSPPKLTHPQRQNQSLQPNKRTPLRTRSPNRLFSRRHLQDPRREIQSGRNLLRKCRYIQHGTIQFILQPRQPHPSNNTHRMNTSASRVNTPKVTTRSCTSTSSRTSTCIPPISTS
jgi:hypothetical protein